MTEVEIDKKVQQFGEYDPKLDLSRFELPNIDLLAKHGDGKVRVSEAELTANKEKILLTLRNFSIEVSSIKAVVGPTVTLYEIVPAPGIRISKIKNLEDDIAADAFLLPNKALTKEAVAAEAPNRFRLLIMIRPPFSYPRLRSASSHPLGPPPKIYQDYPWH